MADLVLPGAWWLHGTRGSNVFLVEADDGSLALIDTGFGTNTREILREMASVAPGRGLAAILLTHYHADHAGSAGPLHAATGAPIALGRGDCRREGGRLTVLPTVGRTHVARFALRRLRGGDSAPAPVTLPVGEETEVLPGIRAVPVPGHTPGSCVYEVPRLNAVFAGDLVISHGGALSRSMRMANRDDGLYLETLAAYAQRAPAHGFPGHGTPLLDTFGDRLLELSLLPRRRPTPGIVASRATKMAGFVRALVRRREPLGP